jgi:hypothetical protein
MVEYYKAHTLLLTHRPTWLTCAVSAVGSSGGLLVSWDSNIYDFVPYICCGGILLTSLYLDLNQPATLLNVYGPCVEKKAFWDKLVTSGILDNMNLIVAGDLNLTLGAGEIWGATTHLDPLSAYFTEFFDKVGLVDVLPDAVMPTWRNGHSGVDSISKRLDRVLVSEDLLVGLGLYKSWVDYLYFSDHASVILRLDKVTCP